MNHHLVGVFALMLVSLGAGGASREELPVAEDSSDFDPYKPAGKVMTIRSRYGYLHSMYIDCRGEARPTVLIDVGIGVASASWLAIVEAVAPYARTCIYDRSGYGYSGPGPGERTTRQIVEELHDLIDVAHIPGPYVLVGHSFGGFTARYFAAKFPRKTVGLVLVDSSHPDQVRRLAALDSNMAKRYRQPSRRLLGQLSREEQAWQRLNTSRKAIYAQMAELRYFAKSARQVSDTRLDRMLPLAVITRSKQQLPTILGLSMEKEWQDMQQQLTHLTGRSWQQIARDSGHDVHKDAPDELARVILRIVSKARQQANSLRAQDW